MLTGGSQGQQDIAGTAQDGGGAFGAGCRGSGVWESAVLGRSCGVPGMWGAQRAGDGTWEREVAAGRWQVNTQEKVRAWGRQHQGDKARKEGVQWGQPRTCTMLSLGSRLQSADVSWSPSRKRRWEVRRWGSRASSCSRGVLRYSSSFSRAFSRFRCSAVGRQQCAVRAAGSLQPLLCRHCACTVLAWPRLPLPHTARKGTTCRPAPHPHPEQALGS